LKKGEGEKTGYLSHEHPKYTLFEHKIFEGFTLDKPLMITPKMA